MIPHCMNCKHFFLLLAVNAGMGTYPVDDRDYRSVLYSLLEKSYQENPYFVPIMKNELDSVRKTLHFMVEKEGKRWFCLYSNKQRIFCN